MPKHEVGTPKWIANRIKAKGLQKLRWYCQMCQKQCRDENGFKCHTTSESHQRQLLLFAENPRKYLDSFSKEFSDDFLQLLRRRFGTKRVHANQVYQEYIADRHHLHMNSTRWETLTGFVKWLGKTSKCKVDQTEKGWFITYIDREPETIKKQEEKAKKEKMDKDDEERLLHFINKQVERAKQQDTAEEPVFTELIRETEEQKIAFNLALKSAEKTEVTPSSSQLLLEGVVKKEDDTDKVEPEKPKLKKESRGEKRKKTALDEIKEEQERLKERTNRKKNWLHEGIVVKVITKYLGEKYYKKKGVVVEVVGSYLALVKMVDSGAVLKLDQTHLETVIPALGRQVKVVNGAYRGCTAVLLEIHADEFACSVKIDAGPLNGRIVPSVKYEDVTKLNVPS